MVVLDSLSRRCVATPGANLPLMPHQEAMVAECISIEEEIFRLKREQDAIVAASFARKTGEGVEKLEGTVIKCGLLDAPVGSGKTLCLLCLCMLRPRSLIVVPSHLYHQWKDAIRKFVKPGALRVREIETYCDTTCLQFVDADKFWNEVDVVLVSSLHFAITVTALVSQGVDFKRIIVDEVDSIVNIMCSPVHVPMRPSLLQKTIEFVWGKRKDKDMLLHMEPIIRAVQKHTDILWLVSSSVSSLYDKSGLTLGSVHIPHAIIEKYHVSCTPGFIATGFALPPIVEESWIIDSSPVISNLLSHLVSGLARKALYAEDPKSVLRALMYDCDEGLLACPDSDVKLARLLFDGYTTRRARLLETGQGQSARFEECENQLAVYQANPNYLDDLDLDQSQDPKFRKVQKILDFARDTPDAKILVFSEYPRVLDQLADRLRDLQIPFVDLEGGNMQAMANAIAKYKQQSACVMLAHSTMFSCGMNLENTTHVIVMHALAPGLREQVIGRGQRPGRTGPLTVIDLLYTGEVDGLLGVAQAGLKGEYDWTYLQDDTLTKKIQ